MEGFCHGIPFEVIQQVTPLGLTVRLQPPGGGPVSRLPHWKREGVGKVWGQESYKIPGQIRSRPISNRPISLPQKVAFWKGNGTPAISGKSRLVKYFNLAR